MSGKLRLYARNPKAIIGTTILLLAVAAANELDPGVDRRCLSGHEPAAAVVAFRVGRVPAYKQAFALPADANLRPGDEVWVRPRSCELEPAKADRATQ